MTSHEMIMLQGVPFVVLLTLGRAGLLAITRRRRGRCDDEVIRTIVHANHPWRGVAPPPPRRSAAQIRAVARERK
jgi:hypothetical protein